MLLAPAASHYCGSSVCGAPGRLLVIVRVALLAVGFIGLRWLLRIFVCDLGPITPISESPIWGGSSTPQLLCLGAFGEASRLVGTGMRACAQCSVVRRAVPYRAVPCRAVHGGGCHVGVGLGWWDGVGVGVCLRPCLCAHRVRGRAGIRACART